MSRLRLLYLLMFLVLWPAAAPDVRAQKLAVSPEDKALVINGTLGSGATSFTRHFTVTLVGGTGTEAKQIQIRRSDLVMQGPNGEVLDRGNLNVAAIALKPGQTMDAALTVNNVTHAGTYTATIKLWLPEQTEADAEVINLTLNVSPRVVVNPPTGASAQVAHCGLLPCRWSNWLPQNLIGNKRGLLLDNQTPGDVAIENQYVVLRGERTGHILTAAEVRPSVASQILPASRSVPVELEIIDRDAIPPDSYIGTLRLGLKGAESPTVVGFTLNVRSAPWWPLVILLLGVIAGRVIQKMSTPEALLQVKLLKRLFRIQDSVMQLRADRDRQLLLERLDDLKTRIDSGSETEQVLTQELDKIEVAVRLLRRLEVLEDDAGQITDVAVRTQILTKIDTAAQTLLGGDATEAARLINEIEISLRQAQTNMADAADASETIRVESALASAREARIVGEEADKVFNAPAARIPGRTERIFAMLAGFNLMNADTRFFVWRPIFFLLLLLLLTFMGLKSLYIDNGTSFGVGGLYDYLGLFLWGLSAEVVQHTLQTVSLPKT